MTIDPQWISACADSIITISLIIGVYQIREQRKEMKNDHERSRREKAVDLLIHFDNILEKETSTTRKLIERLSHNQIEKIYNNEAVEIDKGHKNLLQAALSSDVKVTKGKIHVDEQQSTQIRWQAIKYLNLLETILVAWHNGVADAEIIEKQLKYIYSPKDSSMAMDKFREAAGGKESFPAIHAFIDKLTNDHKKPIEGKNIIT